MSTVSIAPTRAWLSQDQQWVLGSTTNASTSMCVRLLPISVLKSYTFFWCLQIEDEDDERYLELPQGMSLQRLELDITNMDNCETIIPGRLLKAVTEVIVSSSKEPVSDCTLLLSGFASTAALYEELLASSVREFWVKSSVSLRLCTSYWNRLASCPVSLSDLEDAANVALAQGKGYLALTDVTTTDLGITFRLRRVP